MSLKVVDKESSICLGGCLLYALEGVLYMANEFHEFHDACVANECDDACVANECDDACVASDNLYCMSLVHESST